MARYTYTLREIVSTFGKEEVKNWFKSYQLSDYLSNEEINVIRDKNTWNEDLLADRIITHYLNREIGCEAIGEFMNNVNDMMNEVMETYLPLIYSTSLKFNPLNDVEMTETYNRYSDSNSTTNSSSTSKGSGLNIASDTPQGQISKTAILEGDYATSTSANESDNLVKDSSENIGKGTEHFTRKTEGSNRSKQILIDEYRRNIRAINTEIVYALEPLFMSIK